MKQKFEATINLTVDDVKSILLEYLGLPKESRVTFNLRTAGDDRFGPEWKEFGGADIVSEIQNPKIPKGPVYRGNTGDRD